MSTQEIIAELEKMSIEERQQVADKLQKMASPPAEKRTLDLRKVLQEFAGTVDCWPEDMSVNHDHYLYGTPKQQP